VFRFSTFSIRRSSSSPASFFHHFLPKNFLSWNKNFLCFSSTSSSDHEKTKEDSQFFGSRVVSSSEKTKMVGEVFTNVAPNYDLMNDLMSFGIHRLWKESLISELNPLPGMRLLDVAGGTGDIAFRFLEAVKSRASAPSASLAISLQSPRASVTVCDINASMLEVGKERARERGYLNVSPSEIEFVEGNAETLPLPDNSFDVYTIAFGLRNVTNMNLALQEAHRVLKRGGKFFCLEFSKVSVPGISNLYQIYNRYVIPQIGEIVAKDRSSYQYLIESIEQFPDQETLLNMIEVAGFKGVSYRNMTAGVVAVHKGYKL